MRHQRYIYTLSNSTHPALDGQLDLHRARPSPATFNDTILPLHKTALDLTDVPKAVPFPFTKLTASTATFPSLPLSPLAYLATPKAAGAW